MIIRADARHIPLADGSVQCVVTSPPYWGLRDYGTARWDGGDADCDHSDARIKGRFDYPTSGKQLSNNDSDDHRYQSECKCGARRIDAQIGMEPTPETYVATIVQVFREVWRVLRDDGTLWLNLGDSYCGNGGTARGGEGRLAEDSATYKKWERDWCGLKPKDLCGIPWLVAKALQSPYYTGRIKNIEDRIWLAAMIDGEGCIHVHRRPAGQSAYSKFTRKDGSVAEYVRTQDTYGVMVSVDNTSKAIVDRCEEISGQGSRYVHHANTGKQQRKQTLYRWTVTGQQSRELLRELYPYLVAKQQQARIAYWADSNGLDAIAAHEGIKALHKGLDTIVDAKAPPSCFEPGWYLRSDIIWSKMNPMPESVTDRPTRSHEYLFLLAKSERYYFDADAIRESVGMPTKRREIFRGGDSYTQGRSFENGADRRPEGYCGSDQDKSLDGRNKRDVWTVNSEPTPEAHFATFPQKLIEPCILAGTSEKGCCAECGAPRVRVTEKTTTFEGGSGKAGRSAADINANGKWAGKQYGTNIKLGPVVSVTTTAWQSSCTHNAPSVPCVVFDPFGGSGTVSVVCNRLGRRSVLLELSAEYIKIAKKRSAQMGLFSSQQAIRPDVRSSALLASEAPNSQAGHRGSGDLGDGLFDWKERDH